MKWTKIARYGIIGSFLLLLLVKIIFPDFTSNDRQYLYFLVLILVVDAILLITLHLRKSLSKSAKILLFISLIAVVGTYIYYVLNPAL